MITLPKTFRKQALGSVEFVYVAAPTHAVFQHDPATMSPTDYRAIVIAEATARAWAARTVRVGQQQTTLTVSSFPAKIAALEAGLGIGTVPIWLVDEALTRGTLKRLPLPFAGERTDLFLASRVDPRGRAENWFLEQLPPYFAKLAGECPATRPEQSAQTG